MTNKNNKNSILTSIIALTLLTSTIAIGGIQNANAGGGGGFTDINPPEYRHDEDSVFALWIANIECGEPNGIEPLVIGLPVGPPQSFNAFETSGPLFPDAPTELVQLEEGLYAAVIQNIVDEHTTKNVRVQVLTCSFGEPIHALVAGAFAQDNGEEVPILPDGVPVITPNQVGPDSFLTHATYDFIIEPNPDAEAFFIQVPPGSIPISLVVDTVSFTDEQTPDSVCNDVTDGQYPNGIGEVGLDTVLVKCFDAEDPCFAEGVPVKYGDPTECSFAVIGANSFGETFIINDAIPAEWSLIGFEEISSCDEGPANKGKKDGKSATLVECVAQPGQYSGFYATVETRESPGKGHKEGTVYKPTSCGNFKLNDGAVMLLGDENGDPILEEVEDGVFEPIVLAETGPLELEAVSEVCEPELG